MKRYVVDNGSAVSVTGSVDSEFDKHGQKEIYLEILISNLSTFTSCLGVNCAPRIGLRKIRAHTLRPPR